MCEVPGQPSIFSGVGLLPFFKKKSQEVNPLQKAEGYDINIL